MKNICLIILFSAFISTAYSQYGPFPYRSPQQTIGETYVILPLDKMDEGEHLMLKDVNRKSLTNSANGRSLKLISINENEKKAYLKDSAGTDYICLLRNGSLRELVPLKDIEAAKLLINKTFWLNTDEIRTGDILDQSANKRINGLRFEPVAILDIKLNSSSFTPFSFVFKTPKGDTGFVNSNISGTNSDLDIESFFESSFFTQDPKIKYHFDAATWANIKSKHLERGMDYDAVQLILGLPKSMNNTTTPNGLDQWVYPTQNIYFRNGKMVDIQR